MLAHRFLWIASYAIAAFCVGSLINHVVSAYRDYDPDESQLTDHESVGRYLAEYYKTKPESASTINIPTGVFVSTLTWVDANTFQVSGIIWQKYADSIKGKIEEGFILPEATELDKHEVYRLKVPDGEIIGWYFEGTIRQRFDYARYPLDNKIVKIRLWHASFAQLVVLTPDFVSYRSTKSLDKFGLDSEINIGGYDILETFFRYHEPRYDTNFGNSYTDQNTPELYFTIALKRHATDALIIYVLPLIVVFILCFATLISITLNDKKREVFNSSYLEVLNECAALFFVVLLAHIHLREAFSGVGMVNLEYMYVITYLAVVYVALNAFLVLHSELTANVFSRVVTYQDNLLARVLFLPLFSALALWIGLIYF